MLELRDPIKEYEHGSALGRGQGRYDAYQPWLPIRAVKSCAVRSRIFSRKFGRILHFMSNAEVLTFFQLEWNDDVIEIREQYPLHPIVTNQIASELHILPAGYSRGGIVMTTDFLVTYRRPEGGTSLRAYQVKATQKDADHPRTNAKLVIEQYYWKRQSVPSTVVIAELYNRTYCTNLRTFFPERNSHYSSADLSFLSKQMLRLVVAEPNRPVSKFTAALGAMPDSGLCINGIAALKVLVGHKIWKFPLIDQQLFLNSRLGDFEVGYVC